MHKVFVNSPQQAVREVPIDVAELQVGKDSGNHIVLSGWNVAKLHAQFVLHDEEVFVQDLGSLFGTWVDGNRVTRFGPMKGGEEIIIGGHTLVVSLDTALRPAGAEPQDAAEAFVERAIRSGASGRILDHEDPHRGTQHARHRPHGVPVVARIETEPAGREQGQRLVRGLGRRPLQDRPEIIIFLL